MTRSVKIFAAASLVMALIPAAANATAIEVHAASWRPLPVVRYLGASPGLARAERPAGQTIVQSGATPQMYPESFGG